MSEGGETLPPNPSEYKIHGQIGREKPKVVGSIGRKTTSADKKTELSSSIKGFIGRKDSTPLKTLQELLKPEPKKVTILNLDGVQIRQASTEKHQDGIAINPDTKTYVVCDGMGGVGSPSETKNYFAYALAQAISEVPDINELSLPDRIKVIVDKAKQNLKDLGIDSSEIISKSDTPGKVLAVGSTVAAVHKIEGTNKWSVATLGDSSVIVIDSAGRIKHGFGEAWQLIGFGDIQSHGGAEDGPLASRIGIMVDGQSSVQYDRPRSNHPLKAQFEEVSDLEEGDRIVIVSDAYLQKSGPQMLINDVNKSDEQWASGVDKEKGGLYGDDASMIIIDPRLV